MTDVEELADTLRALAAALDAEGVPWAVCGSLASTAYGEPRATNDVDVVAALSVEQARRLAGALADGFYADPDVAVDAARRGGSFNAIHQETFLKVDVFIPPPGPMGRGQLDRRRVLELMPDLSVPVLGPEDTVLQKLRWFARTGESSDRQWRDLLSVVRAVELDRSYLDPGAADAGLGGLLRRLLEEAEQP